MAAGEDCPEDGEDGIADDESAVDEEAKEPSSRAVKHKAVEQRRKKKISDGVHQLLETLRPSSPSGKMVREREREKERENREVCASYVLCVRDMM